MSRAWKLLLSFVIFVSICYGGLVWFVNHEVKKSVNQAIADVQGLELTFTDLSVSIADHSVSIANVETTLPQGQHATAETVRITAFDQINPIPHFLTAEASGISMTVSPENFGELAAPMLAMGITTFKGDISVDYSYDSDRQALTLTKLLFKAKKLGDVKISGIADRLDLSELGVEKLLGLRIVNTDIIFVDHALIKAMIQSAARNLATSEDDARTRICSELAAMANYASQEGNDIAENAMRGLKRFVDEPGSVNISARPAEPVPLLYFFMGRDFYDNIRLMNVVVTTDEHDEI